MDSQLTINDQLFEQLKSNGEILVRESHGVEIVMMTVDARRKLNAVAYDDSEWSGDAAMGLLAEQLKDPEGWGHPSMDSYDTKYGHLFDDQDAQNQ